MAVTTGWLIPARYPLEAVEGTKNLNFVSTSKGNIIEIAATQDPRDFPEDSLERSVTVIEHRLNLSTARLTNVDVCLDGKGRIRVQVTELKSIQELQDLITTTGDAILMKCGALPFPLRVVKSTRVAPPAWGKK
jgi:preprotein translocase subunit SecD